MHTRRRRLLPLSGVGNEKKFNAKGYKKKTNAKGYKRKVSVPVFPTNNPFVRARCVLWPLLRYSHSAALGQQTRMRVHCGDFASYFLFHRGSGISSLPCGCYINIPPVRAGLITWFDARRAVVPHFHPPGFDVCVSTPSTPHRGQSSDPEPVALYPSPPVTARSGGINTIPADFAMSR